MLKNRKRAKGHALCLGWLAGAALAVPGAAFAQDAPPPGDPAGAAPTGTAERLVYTPADFAQFGPRSALDMLKQVPGFTIDDPLDTGSGGGFNNDNPDVRGLGQASGNVLLNGERFTSKSDSLTNQLARIAAEDVVRIEMVDGATLNLPGLSGRVANVVALSSSKLSGQAEWKGELRGKHSATDLWGLSTSVTGSTGPLSFVFSVQNESFRGGADGYNIVTYANGVVEDRTNAIRPRRDKPKLNGSLRLDGAGWVANLSGSYIHENFRVPEIETWLPVPGSTLLASEILQTHSPEESFEIGADVGFGLGPGYLTLIGLFSHEDDEFDIQGVIDRADGSSPTGSRFIRQGVAKEKILRAEYGWGMLGGDWQLSGEGAYNTLDRAAELFTLAPDGTFAEVPFPSGTGGVSEDRYELLLFHGRPLSDSLTLQATVGGEYSKIAQSGANALSRTFLRPKGSLGLAWAARPGLDLSFTLTREVGQLDFDDFLAEVNVGDANTNAGNNELRPEQKLTAELETAKRLGPWGSATVTLFATRVSDYVTIVPLAGGGESTGNIPSAREYGARLLWTLMLDPIGLRGAKFDVEATFQNSSLTDPTTGEKRGFDKYEPRKLKVKYRHDIPGTPLAVGGEYDYLKTWPYYRVAEIGTEHSRANDLYLFVEHKDIFGLTGKLGVRNVLHSDVILYRTLTDGPRGSSPLRFSEDRRREVGHYIDFSLKGSF